MPQKRLMEQYPEITNFLSTHFHKNAFYEQEFAITMNDLIDSIMDSYFIHSNGVVPTSVERLLEEMKNFLDSLVYTDYKIKYVNEMVHTDFGGLEPLEFIQYLYYRLKVEVNELKILLEEGGDEE